MCCEQSSHYGFTLARKAAPEGDDWPPSWRHVQFIMRRMQTWLDHVRVHCSGSSRTAHRATLESIGPVFANGAHLWIEIEETTPDIGFAQQWSVRLNPSRLGAFGPADVVRLRMLGAEITTLLAHGRVFMLTPESPLANAEPGDARR